jgi:hypothetical protein
MMPSVFPNYLYLFAFACGCLVLAVSGRMRFRRGLLPVFIHRCRARPLFSQVGSSSFVLDAVVETCDDPTVPRGMPFSLRLTRPPNRRSDYLFTRVRALVEQGHALIVDVEDYVITRTARLCANGWTVVLDVDHASGWPSYGL